MKPVIAITSYIKKDEFRNYLQVGYEYIDKIEQANGIPLVLPVLKQYTEYELDNIIDSIDGIIFTGGCNVDSTWYGEKPIEEQIAENTLRNKFERDLFIYAKKKKKPILGICRGCQLINVLLDGSLIQNIDDEIDTKIYHKGTVSKIYEKQHTICLENNSILKTIYNQDKILVNSFHGQCIKKLGKNLKVTAICCEDGLIEAIEYEGDCYITGIQWHPEALDDQIELFKKFVEVCKKENVLV